MEVQIWRKIPPGLQAVKVEKIFKWIIIGIFSEHDFVQGFCQLLVCWLTFNYIFLNMYKKMQIKVQTLESTDFKLMIIFVYQNSILKG